MDNFIFLRDTFLLLLYTLTSLLSLIVNGLVCKISFQRRNKSTNFPLGTTYIYLLNLALADGLSGLTIPIQFLFCSKYFLENYFFSSYICIIIKSIQILAYNTSTLTICVIAFDRYKLIQNPFQQYYQRKPFRAILFTWICSGLFSISCLISMKVHTYFNSYEKLISCKILFPITLKYFPNNYINKIRIICFIFFFNIIPFIIIICLCSLTMKTIARRSIIGVQQFQTFEQSRTRSIRLLMIIVCVFILSRLPINFIRIRYILNSLSNISPICSIQINKCNDSTIYLLFYWLSISSCCHNPIIYSWFNRKYRILLLHWYQSIIYCRRSS